MLPALHCTTTRRNCGTASLELKKLADCFIAIRQHYTSRAFLVRCRGTPSKLIKCLYLSITSPILHLSRTRSRDRTMNSDAYELQMDEPFASGALRDRRHYNSSAMLLTGQGPVSDAVISMAVPHGDWNQNTKRIKETISALLIVYIPSG